MTVWLVDRNYKLGAHVVGTVPIELTEIRMRSVVEFIPPTCAISESLPSPPFSPLPPALPLSSMGPPVEGGVGSGGGLGPKALDVGILETEDPPNPGASAELAVLLGETKGTNCVTVGFACGIRQLQNSAGTNRSKTMTKAYLGR